MATLLIGCDVARSLGMNISTYGEVHARVGLS